METNGEMGELYRLNIGRNYIYNNTLYASTVEDVKCRPSLFKEMVCENRGINAPREMLRKESHTPQQSASVIKIQS